MSWKKCKKKPVVVEFREPQPPFLNIRRDGKLVERINTLEGIEYAVVGEDFVIRGINGELYPIKKEIFLKTYEVLE